jgi:hypothetical protein
MKKKFFGAVVAPISIVGLTFALGLGTTAFGAGELQQDQDDTLISTLNVTTDIPVAPWCGWYVSGGPDGDLALEPDAEVSAPTTYIGTEIALTKTATQNTAYVGPEDGLETEGASDDCSWFEEGNKYGARYDVVATGNKFTARALTTSDGVLDAEMDFYAESVNPLKLTNVGIDSCSTEFETNPLAELAGTSLTTTPWRVITGVTNNNFCQWATKYEIKIPANMSPTYGAVTYRWTGPTLTHTLVIPESQIGSDPVPE